MDETSEVPEVLDENWSDEGDREFQDFKKYFKEVYMQGVVQYINPKKDKKGNNYVTIALADGTTGLIVRSESLMDMLVEGNTYEITVDKQGIFTTVTDLKLIAGEAPKPGEPPKPGSYKSEYQKRKHPIDQAVIAIQAFSKSLIDAYGRVWAADPEKFKNRDVFNEAVRDDTAKYLQWITDTVAGLDEQGEQ